jgi:hypothetical protein
MRGLNNFLVSLFKPNKIRVLCSAAISGFMTWCVSMPIVQIPFLCLAYPLYVLVPELGKTGDLAVAWFFGVFFKSPIAFVYFFIYYFFMMYLILFKLGSRSVSNDKGEA